MRNDFLPFSRPDLDGSELAPGRAKCSNPGGSQRALGPTGLNVSLPPALGRRTPWRSTPARRHCIWRWRPVGLGPDDEVITTPYTFASTAEVVRYFGAQPRFVDIQSDTLNIDPNAVAAAISPRTRAVLPVHVGGHPAEMDASTRSSPQTGWRWLRTPPTPCRPPTAAQVSGPAGPAWRRSPPHLLQLLRHQDHDHRRGRHDLHRR